MSPFLSLSTGRVGSRALLSSISLGVIFSIAVYSAAWNLETQKITIEFEQDAGEAISSLSGRLDQSLQELESVARFLTLSPNVNRQRFREFVRPFLSRYPGIQALEWIPRVTAPERNAFEQAARQEGFHDFQFTEQNIQGQMVRAAIRPEYFPVYFVEPYRGNEAALGFDLASEPVRLQSLTLSRDTGRPTATPPIRLIQETESQRGFLIFWPIYRREALMDSVESRRANLRGFALAVFRAGDLIEKALKYLKPTGLDLYLFDEAAPPGERLLYFRASHKGQAPDDPNDLATFRQGLHHVAVIEVGGRKWSALLKPGPGYVGSKRGWWPWAIIMAGLLLTASLAVYLIEQKRAEDKLRASMEAAIAAEKKYQGLLESAPDAMLAVNREGRIVLANGQAEKLFGYGREELLQQPVELLIPERFREVHLRHRASYYARPASRPMGVGLDLYARRKDGTETPVDIALSPIEIDGGFLALAIIRDITQRKEAEKALRARYQELQNLHENLARANRVKDEFLSVMSHELRTPLNVVMGYVGLIKDGMLGDINPKQEEALEKVLNRTQDQLSMVTGILQAAYLEAGEVKAESQEVSLGDFLENLKSDFAISLEKELALVWDYPPDLPLITTDSGKLRQILQNLINNAIKFTEKGSVTVSVRVKEGASETSAEFKVADTGIGIPEDMLPAIFEKFKQVDSSETRLYGGAGLGLYIVKKFTELLGGTVAVESEPGKGSTFTVGIPCEPSTP